MTYFSLDLVADPQTKMVFHKQPNLKVIGWPESINTFVSVEFEYLETRIALIHLK